MPEPKTYENEVVNDVAIPDAVAKPSAYSKFSIGIDAQGGVLPLSSLESDYIEEAVVKQAIVTDNVVFTNETTEKTLISTTLVGGKLGTNNGIRITIIMSELNAFGANSTMSFKLKYGSTTVATLTYVVIVGTTSTGIIYATMFGNGATNAQDASISGIFGGTLAVPIVIGSATEDSTIDKTFEVTGQFDTVNNNATMSHAFIELIR